MAVRRLKKDGLVRVQNGGEVSLTAAGRAARSLENERALAPGVRYSR
jgi:Mn-dependent DtxR family transcriptional regulator